MSAAMNQAHLADDQVDGAVGCVGRLLYGPVKGLDLASPRSVGVTATGLEGDRLFFLIDANDTLLSITRSGALAGLSASWDPAAERLSVTGADVEVTDAVRVGEAVEANFFGHHQVPGHVVVGPWAEFFSDRVGRHVRLVRADQHNGAVDMHPVTLMAEASVQALAEHAGAPADPRRFRMSIGLDGPPPFAEDGWAGKLLHVGDVTLRMGGPVKRCAATTRDPNTGRRDLPVLRLLKGLRGLQPSELGTGVNLGVYAQVLQPGRVAVGDQVRLTTGDAGASTPSQGYQPPPRTT